MNPGILVYMQLGACDDIYIRLAGLVDEFWRPEISTGKPAKFGFLLSQVLNYEAGEEEKNERKKKV